MAGLTLPGLAHVIRDWLPAVVAVLLFLGAFRIGIVAAFGGLADLGRTLGLALGFQFALPIAGLALVLGFGAGAHPLALALLVMLSAPSITGNPNFAAIMGHDPAPPMRLLILGTAIFPLTTLPTLWLLPALGGPGAVLAAAARLLAVIGIAVGLGFAARRAFFRDPGPDTIRAVDGASAIALGVLVVGLMSALGPALKTEPATVLAWLAVATCANWGLQVTAHRLGAAPGEALVAGNRNISLFLVALPPEVTDPLLIFIGCYQIPMYLTPMVMNRLYRARRTAT